MKEKEEKKKTSREIPQLSHVETKKQEVDHMALSDAFKLKEDYEQQHKIELGSNALSAEDHTILVSFEKKRMLLDRIWIIVNQARAQMQLDPLKRDEIKSKLLRMVDLGYLTYEEIPYEKQVNVVFVLTEKGQDLIQ